MIRRIATKRKLSESSRNNQRNLLQVSHIEGRAIKLMPPGADSVLSKGYQLHIEVNDSYQILEECVKPIATAKGLTTAKEGQVLEIYRLLALQKSQGEKRREHRL